MNIKQLYLLIKENKKAEKEFYKSIDKVENVSIKKAYEICNKLKKEIDSQECNLENNTILFKKYKKICEDFLNEIK